MYIHDLLRESTGVWMRKEREISIDEYRIPGISTRTARVGCYLVFHAELRKIASWYQVSAPPVPHPLLPETTRYDCPNQGLRQGQERPNASALNCPNQPFFFWPSSSVEVLLFTGRLRGLGTGCRLTSVTGPYRSTYLSGIGLQTKTAKKSSAEVTWKQRLKWVLCVLLERLSRRTNNNVMILDDVWLSQVFHQDDGIKENKLACEQVPKRGIGRREILSSDRMNTRFKTK